MFTLKKISEVYPISVHALKIYIRNGRLKAEKINGKWFVSRENMQAYLDSRWKRN